MLASLQAVFFNDERRIKVRIFLMFIYNRNVGVNQNRPILKNSRQVNLQSIYLL